MATKKLRIYSQEITPRLEYAAEIIFSSILGIEYEITADRRKIGGNPAIIYSDEKVREQFVIRPSGLLAASGVTPLEPEVAYLDDLPVLFPSEGGSIAFDIFSAAFYMLSRYEEYLPFAPDVHGRYQAIRSLAYRKGFLQMPVVELWSRYLAGLLVKSYPVLSIRHNEFSSLVTVDVDQPFAYRSRGLLRSVGGLMKGLAGTGARPAERIRTMAGSQTDPYDNFDYIEQQLQLNGSNALFFFPTGDQGEYDHSPPYRDNDYREIIRRYDKMYGSGLHPSYRSAGRPKTLRMETDRYRSITGHGAERARQHWLLLSMPETYQSYIDAGIRADYTMGYADEPGFRAGIARPFPFYDLSREKITGLTIVPFQVMDGTLRQYLHLSPEAALVVIRSLIAVTRRAGGMFVSVWHNTSLTEVNGWEGWRNVFEETLALQKV
ncbi:MAG: polysaccharide deacetylase family protein [Bacteroidales bacterium]|nr:polysaccharide deacetylase family protein [Bacteroidales bacterium]